MPLSDKDFAFYQTQGYLPVEGLLSKSETDALRTRIREYTHEGRDRSRLVFQSEPRVARGELKVDHPGDAVRKIDNLFESDDLFEKLGKHPAIVSVVQEFLGPDIKMFRNSLLLKPPEVGSAKGMHQDSPYWPIQPMELCSCWFAIDDATPENGCMGVIPEWHLKGPLPHITVPDDFVMAPDSYDPKDTVLAPLKAGGGLFFHSLIPHVTAPNRSNHWRRAIALSYMSSKSRLTKPMRREFPIVSGRSYPGCV
jgi:phytanoyl-CoA hydroxylase